MSAHGYKMETASGGEQIRMDISPILQIAVVEDDTTLASTLEDMLLGEGYRVHLCPTAAALRTLMARTEIDMILLDLSLPDGNGLAVAAQIRATASVRIIILTGKGSELDRIVGLEIGADDYVVKPFSIREVAARIRAVLRRGRNAPPAPADARKGYRFAGWTLDTDLRRLLNSNGKQISLTVGEFDLLHSIVSAERRILSRDQLLEMTRRSSNDDVFDRTIDVLIMRLRRKIETNPHIPEFIVTERGIGYRFNVAVERFDCD
ncbi:response regulator transcription factor [Pararhizobium sp.]|uniref:response regulator transcription factor n=1 Tax=Pararhizobium sp. TaxID=1977563 RepID=UPI00271F8E54|nr:response regulator transcription factor [Pararhizobium sp.]MDO9417811.1 response regulator transcription factor [Pararhizobium sp.]